MHLLRRALVLPAILVIAVLAQVTVVNRLPLPGDASPDLVLLVVVALAVTGGPVPGMLAGFAGGLALDLAPPVSNLAGETAFVFCAAGYACGILAVVQSRQEAQAPATPLLSLPVMATGAGIAEALRAGLGLMLSDPRMTGPAITHVLPSAVVYDLLFCPLALWLVAAPKGAREPASAVLGGESKTWPHGRAVVRAAGAGAAVLTAGKAAAVPRLTFAGNRQAPLRAPVPPLPKLRLGTGSPQSLSLSGTSHGTTSAHPRQGSAPVRVHFDSAARDGAIGGGALQGPGLRGGTLRSAAFSRRGGGFGGGLGVALGPSLFAGPGTRKPGRNWLRARNRPFAGAARGTSGGTGVRLLAGRPHGVARSPGKGWLEPGKPAGRSSPGRRPAEPGSGWARGRGAAGPGRSGKSASSASGNTGNLSSPGKGWLRPAKPVAQARRKSPGRGWLERKPARVMWQRKSPGRGWLGRGTGLLAPGKRGAGLRASRLGSKALGSSRTRTGGRR